MVSRDSNNPDILRMELLIRDYINNSNSNAGIELSNINDIKGNDLLTILDNLSLDTEKQTEEYRRTKYDYDAKVKDYAELEEKYKKSEEKYKELLGNLELILKNPFISGIEELIKIIRETK